MVDRMFGGSGGPGGRQPFNWNALFSMGDISPKTQQHLSQVYRTLMASAASCVLGMYINSAFVVTGFFITILAIVAMGYLMY
jgi:hypothetical protein